MFCLKKWLSIILYGGHGKKQEYLNPDVGIGLRHELCSMHLALQAFPPSRCGHW